MSVGNNIVFDYGDEGFVDTIEALDGVGIKHVGGGMNLEQALSPAIIDVNGEKIGFLGFASTSYVRVARAILSSILLFIKGLQIINCI